MHLISPEELASAIADRLSAERYGKDITDAEVKSVLAAEVEKLTAYLGKKVDRAITRAVDALCGELRAKAAPLAEGLGIPRGWLPTDGLPALIEK